MGNMTATPTLQSEVRKVGVCTVYRTPAPPPYYGVWGVVRGLPHLAIPRWG